MWLFIEQHEHAKNKDSINFCIANPISGIYCWSVYPLNTASNEEDICMPWHHHALSKSSINHYCEQSNGKICPLWFDREIQVLLSRMSKEISLADTESTELNNLVLSESTESLDNVQLTICTPVL